MSNNINVNKTLLDFSFVLPSLRLKKYNDISVNLITKLKNNFDYNSNDLNIYVFEKDDLTKFEKIDCIKGISFRGNTKGFIFITSKKNIFNNIDICCYKNCYAIIRESRFAIQRLKIAFSNTFGDIFCYIGSDFCCNNIDINLWEDSNIIIGNNCLFSWNVSIFNSDGHAIFQNIVKSKSDNFTSNKNIDIVGG